MKNPFVSGRNEMTAQDFQRQNADVFVVARGAGIVFFGAAAGNVIRYAGHVIMARYLGLDVFGLLILGLTVLSTSAVFAELGLSGGIVRYVSLFRGIGDIGRLKGTISLGVISGFVSGVVAGAALFFLAPFLSERIFNSPGLTEVLRILGLALPFMTATSMFVYAAQGLKAMAAKAFIKDYFDSLVKIAFIVIIVLLDGGLVGILLSYTAAAGLGLMLALFFLKRLVPELMAKSVPAVREARKIFQFSWPLLFVQLIGRLLLGTDIFMLGILRTPEEVGIYGSAQKTALLCGMVLNAFLAIFAPIMADYLNRSKREEAHALYKIVSKWSFSLTLPFGLMLIAFSRPMVRIFGSGFEAASVPLAILAAGWLVHSLMGTAGTLLTMSGRTKLHLANFIVLFLGNIGLNLLLIPRFGIVGAAAATALTIVLVDVLTIVEIRILLKMSPFRADILKPLVAGVAAAAPVLLLTQRGEIEYNNILIGIAAVFGIVVFALILWKLGISDEEKQIKARIIQSLKRKKDALF